MSWFKGKRKEPLFESSTLLPDLRTIRLVQPYVTLVYFIDWEQISGSVPRISLVLKRCVVLRQMSIGVATLLLMLEYLPLRIG